MCATRLALGSLSFLGGLQPVHISENEETRAGIQSGTGAWSNLHDIAHPLSCSAAADTAPMSFSALSTCSRSTATTCDSGYSRKRKRALANLLRRRRDGISFNEIGFPVEVAAVKRRTTNSQLISRVKTI